jgi:tRNA A37 threonylcarbamoyladenosine modification protein TsaB
MGTTAALFEVCLEPNQARAISYSAGVGFSTGIQIAVTSGRGLTDNSTAVALGDVTGHVNWA